MQNKSVFSLALILGAAFSLATATQAQTSLVAQTVQSTDNTDHADHPAPHHEMIMLGDITISNPQIRAMIPGAKVAAGYMLIKNGGEQADRLVAVTSPDAERVEIHEMSMENDVMKMRQLADGLPLPAGETTELKSGGYHLMFMQPHRIFKEGETVSVTLEFEKAGKTELTIPVTNAKGQSSDHSHH